MFGPSSSSAVEVGLREARGTSRALEIIKAKILHYRNISARRSKFSDIKGLIAIVRTKQLLRTLVC